jgi:hypothetical protein
LGNGACDDYDKSTAYIGGGGRSKPAWAERIGKKYQWIALYRLASLLHDKITPKPDSFHPKPVRTPLILVEERKLDPTLSQTVCPEKGISKYWWLHGEVDLLATRALDFAAWVKYQDDLPQLPRLLETTTNGGQRWITLTAYPTWNDHKKDAGREIPYRDSWIQIRSYLVLKRDLKMTVAELENRNFFGKWLPEGGKWLYGFVGEYPWATAFNTDPDWYDGATDRVDDSKLRVLHTSNEVVVEWEYDASLPRSMYLEVPAKKFFAPHDLWWNGTDGFLNNSGRTVFFDPRIRHGGKALLADLDDLLERLDRIGCRLIWTMLGEKLIINDNSLPSVTFSQLAVLNKDGTLDTRRRNFFKQG